MYNRYVPRGNGHVRVRVEEPEPEKGREQSFHQEKYTPPPLDAQGKGQKQEENFSRTVRVEPGETGAGHSGDKSVGLKRVLRALKLESVDSGDLLLFLILLLLLTDGDELDLLIALGLIAVMGMGDKKSPDSGGLSGLLSFL